MSVTLIPHSPRLYRHWVLKECPIPCAEILVACPLEKPKLDALRVMEAFGETSLSNQQLQKQLSLSV